MSGVGTCRYDGEGRALYLARSMLNEYYIYCVIVDISTLMLSRTETAKFLTEIASF